MSGGSTQTSQQTTSTQLPQWVLDAGQNNYGVAQDIASKPNPYYQGPTAVGTNGMQASAGNNAWYNMGQASDRGYGLLDNMAAYSPNISASPVGAAQTSAVGYNPTGYSATGYNASTAAAPGTIAAGQLANTNLAPYMNPYIDDVVSSSMGQLNQQAALNRNNISANAVKSGAFGGTRSAVEQGVADAQTAMQAGTLSSNLYSAGFNNAQQAAVGDINRRLTADTTNVANKIGVDEFNANSLNNAGQFNANAANTAGQFNAGAANAAASFGAGATNAANTYNAGATNSMGQFNASQNLSAQQAQDAATRAGYGLQLSGIGGMSGVNNANSAAVGQFGTQQQQTDQSALTGQISQFNQNAAYPTQQLGLLESALGMTPYDTTTNSSGTVNKTQSPDFASLLLGGYKAAFPNGGFSFGS